MKDLIIFGFIAVMATMIVVFIVAIVKESKKDISTLNELNKKADSLIKHKGKRHHGVLQS